MLVCGGCASKGARTGRPLGRLPPSFCARALKRDSSALGSRAHLFITREKKGGAPVTEQAEGALLASLRAWGGAREMADDKMPANGAAEAHDVDARPDADGETEPEALADAGQGTKRRLDGDGEDDPSSGPMKKRAVIGEAQGEVSSAAGDRLGPH